MGKCAQNGAQLLSGWENVQEATLVATLNTKAQKPPCNFFRRSLLTNAAALQNGAVSFPDGTIRGFEAGLPQSSLTVNGQHLAPPREPIRLSTNTRFMPSSSPRQGKASRNALFFQPPILPLSRLSRSEPNSSAFLSPNTRLSD